MTRWRGRPTVESQQHWLSLILLLPAPVNAQTALPLRVGFYSSGRCANAANAELLHFDGKNLLGAHSADCRSDVAQLARSIFRIDEKCPAEQLGDAVPAGDISRSQRLTVLSETSFNVTNAGNHHAPVFFRFCAKTLHQLDNP